MRLALVMHNPLAAAFKDCATHILGSPPNIECFDILPNADPEQEINRIKDWVFSENKDRAVIIICDLYGATPFNIAAKVHKISSSKDYEISLFTGANLCMLLKALTESQNNTDLLIQKIYDGALRGIIKIDTT